VQTIYNSNSKRSKWLVAQPGELRLGFALHLVVPLDETIHLLRVDCGGCRPPDGANVCNDGYFFNLSHDQLRAASLIGRNAVA